MFAVIALALMGVLAIVAPRHGTDTRPDFSTHADR